VLLTGEMLCEKKLRGKAAIVGERSVMVGRHLLPRRRALCGALVVRGRFRPWRAHQYFRGVRWPRGVFSIIQRTNTTDG
jgi:hypothetical protein